MNIVEFKQKLALSQTDYEKISSSDGDYLHLRFIGPFNQQTIIWDAHLYSLAYYIKTKVKPRPASAKQFIHVGDENDSGREITIALNVPIIDEPTVLKTMIMVRQYKNLKLGHHEYGQEVEF